MSDEKKLTTQQAAWILGLDISRVQQLCRLYITTGQGIVCERIGEGRHATYYVSEEAVRAYQDTKQKAGYPKGTPRAGIRGRKAPTGSPIARSCTER